MRTLGLFCVLLLLAACAKAKDKPTSRIGLNARLNCSPESFRAATDDIPRLRPSESCPKFVGYLIAALAHQATGRDGAFVGQPDSMEVIGLVDTSQGVLSTTSGPAGYSKTNVQEAGVDEADIIKTDGKRIYLLHDDTLQILKSWPPTDLSKLAQVTLEGQPAAMLLHESRAAVVSYVDHSVGDADGEFRPSTRLTVIDVANPARPLVERTIDMEISYVDARLVNGRLLLAGHANQTAPSLDVDHFEQRDAASQRAAIAQAVTQTTFDDWLPTMVDSAVGERQLMVDDFNALYVPSVTGTVGATAIVSLDLAHAGAALNKVMLSAQGGDLYATADALYITYSSRWWWWWGSPGGSSVSYLHRLRLNEEAIPHYTGSVTVPGWIAEPFWMSEYDKHLRVVSNEFGMNRLRTYDVGGNADPELLAEIKGFAPNETITGVRFMGSRAYVSTAIIQVDFIKDPFFTFDLGDPAAPKLMGALEMPGYTTYIHPLNDDYVLAVGMFAAAMGDPVTAVQVQVFDVRDFAHPVTASQHVFAVGDTGISFSEALNNHHAFTFYEPEGIFALPLADFTGSWSTAFNGLVAMRVGADASLTELGRVNHYALGSEGYWASDVRRSIVMEGDDGSLYLYSVSAQGMIVNDMADFDTIVDSLKLPLPDDY